MSAVVGYEVVMPKLGLIMTEARLAEWYKQDGQRVEMGELLFALESEKSTLDIDAPAGGTLQILVPEGETVPVMTPVARILGDDTTIPGAPFEPTPVPQQDHPVEKSTPRSRAISSPDGEIRATPKARSAARKRSINLAGMRGSGLRGMVVTADLDQIARMPVVDVTPVARRMADEVGLDLNEIQGTGPGGRITRDDVSRRLAAVVAQSTAPSPSQRLPLTGLRGIIAQRLSESWRERPQVTLTTEVEATDLVNLRKQLGAKTGQSISFNAFFILAAAQALREQPHVNARLTAGGLVKLKDVNIGLAVDTDRGLLVPVVQNADTKTLVELDSELKTLAQRALNGESLPDELTGGTFTITNLGQYGIDAFTPIINPPEMVVLGIGRISPRPFVVGGKLEVRDTVTLSLSFDHRLIDGAPAARFLQRIAALIESPSEHVGLNHGIE